MELRISISNVFEIANASQNCRGGLFPEIRYSQTGVNFFYTSLRLDIVYLIQQTMIYFINHEICLKIFAKKPLINLLSL